MNDGGPAFPCSTWTEEHGVQIGTPVSGMSLRDYFAAKAMQALIYNLRPEVRGDGYVFPSEWRPVVSGAWKMADEMLRERNSTPTETPATSDPAP